MKKINWMYLAQFLVTTAAAFMSAMFNMQHDALPPWIAWPLAAGFEIIFLSGLIAADRLAKSRWIGALVIAASLTSFTYGMLYILGIYAVIPSKPEGWIAVGLALAHVLPMPVLTLCAARLYHASRARAVAMEQAAADAAAKRNQEDEDSKVARARNWRDAEVARQLRNQEEEDRLRLENVRKDADLARWEREQATKAQHRATVAASRTRNPSATMTATARVVVYDGVEYPTILAAAQAHGISRQAMSKRLAKKEAS
jgi:hypothetical protein